MNVVSFKTAQFLQNLGYNEGSVFGYLCNGKLKTPYFGEIYRNSDTTNDVCFEAPDLLDVIEWLKKHKQLQFKIDSFTGMIRISNNISTTLTYIKNISFKEMVQKALDLYENHFDFFEKEYNPLDE